MKKILVISPYHDRQRQQLIDAAAGRCELMFTQQGSEECLRLLPEADAILGNPTRKELPLARKADWIQIDWSGIDRYAAMDDFPERIRLTNVTGVYGDTIAEHLMASMLSLCRSMPQYYAQQSAEVWADAGPQKTLEGATVLILGAGNIGSELARRLSSFKCGRVIGVRRTVRALPEFFDEMDTLEQADALLPQADFVVCALPNTAETRGFFNKRRLLLMKPDAILCNVGRGTLIVTDDLVEVLQSGHLWGVSTDVTEPEPLPKGHPLWHLPNVIVTPHIAGHGFCHLLETENKITAIACDNLNRYLSGQPLRNLVDLKAGYRTSKF